MRCLLRSHHTFSGNAMPYMYLSACMRRLIFSSHRIYEIDDLDVCLSVPATRAVMQKRLSGSSSCLGWRLLGTRCGLCQITLTTCFYYTCGTYAVMSASSEFLLVFLLHVLLPASDAFPLTLRNASDRMCRSDTLLS